MQYINKCHRIIITYVNPGGEIFINACG